jgi:CYTH domain-containing protein
VQEQKGGSHKKVEVGSAPQEIERKFLVQKTPDNVRDCPSNKVVQGYIMVSDNGGEVRLRQKGDKYYLTVKTGAGLVRLEYETEIDRAQFETLWPSTEGRRVEKVRYKVAHQSNIIELDIYEGNLAGLMTAEVEFGSVNDSSRFTPPKWFGDEVTEDSRYKNKNLALHGLPSR